MSALGEKTLMMLLTDTDSVEFIVRDGLNVAVIPTIDLRPVVEWTMAYYRGTGTAPTPDILNEHYADLLADNSIDPAGDVDETIEWAVQDLKGSFVRNQAGIFAREMLSEITEAQNDERVDVISRASTTLSALAMSVQSASTQVDMRESGDRILADYEVAVQTQGQVLGMAFGIPEVDAYTRGIQEGELAIAAGGPKTGKSFFLDWVAYQEWLRGRVPALFTLENSIKMTEMRIACMATHIDSMALMDGTLDEEDYKTLVAWVNDVLKVSDTPMLIFTPDDALRTPQALVQIARAYDADSMVIDQLSFLDNAKANKAKERRHDIYDITKDLRVMISTGRKPLPALLAHQINREGIKKAEQSGRLAMYHMAESADVERICDWAFGFYASDDDRIANEMHLQTLAVRRAPARDFRLSWQPQIGLINVMRDDEIDMTGIV